MGAKMQQGRHLEADPWTLVMKKVSKKGQSPEAVATTYSEHTGLKPFEYLEAPPGMEGFSSDSGDKISTDIGTQPSLIGDEISGQGSARSSETSSKVIVSLGSMRSSSHITTCSESTTNDTPTPTHRQFYTRKHVQQRTTQFRRPPCSNVEALRQQIKLAQAGIGEIQAILAECNFAPREAAYTKLISDCGSNVIKACELWYLMRHNPNLRPNTISYSALINVCARAGDCHEAEKIFASQLHEAVTNLACLPNHITYNNLISACLKARQVERALYWHAHMTKAEIEGDGVLHSNLLTACIESGQSIDCILDIMERMHANGHSSDSETYIHILHELAEQGDYEWNKAVEIFVCASMAGAELTVDLCRTLLVMLDNADAALPAIQMLESFIVENYTAQAKLDLTTMTLNLCSRLGKAKLAMRLWKDVLKPNDIVNSDIARLVLEAIENDTSSRGKAEYDALTAELHAFSSMPV